MDVRLALLADYANVTKESKLNVMGIFSVINAPVIPWVHPQMQLVLGFVAGPAEWETDKEIQVKLLNADGKQLLAVSGGTKVPKGEAGRPVQLNMILTLSNVKFDTEGDYQFSILVGGEIKTDISLSVNHVPPKS